MKSGRLLLVLVGVTLLAVPLYILISDKTCDILRTSVKLRIPEFGEKIGFPLRWTTGGILLLAQRTNRNVIATLYDPVTSAERTITNIGEYRTGVYQQKWQVYAHSNLLVLDSISETNFVSLFYDLAHPIAVTNSSNGFLYGNLFWMPTEPAWLRISGSNYKIERADGSSQVITDKRFRPLFAVGFVSDYVFACATNDVIQSDKSEHPYPERIDLEYWQLRRGPKLLATKMIWINGDKIIAAEASEQGDRILWICFHKLPVPNLTMSAEPILPMYDTRLYISSNNIDGFHCIGSFPTDQVFPHVQWLPDGTGLWYDYDGSQYVYRFD